MSKKERPLPKPPKTPFGRKNKFDQEENQGSLLADRMAQAAAEGKLDEFLKQEMPDNEFARNLASMMMGMTGMMPSPAMGTSPPEAKTEEKHAEGEEPGTTEVPDDVRQAIMGGDLQGLMGLLRREHQKRNPDAPLTKEEEELSATAQEPSSAATQPAIDKEIIDTLVKIALENNVTLDWIILRAIKVYVQEYQKTGKL